MTGVTNNLRPSFNFFIIDEWDIEAKFMYMLLTDLVELTFPYFHVRLGDGDDVVVEVEEEEQEDDLSDDDINELYEKRLVGI